MPVLPPDIQWGPLPQNLYSSFPSTKEALEYAYQQLPITNRNDLVSVLKNYHNTLLREMNEKTNQ